MHEISGHQPDSETMKWMCKEVYKRSDEMRGGKNRMGEKARVAQQGVEIIAGLIYVKAAVL